MSSTLAWMLAEGIVALVFLVPVLLAIVIIRRPSRPDSR
jgi:hypothetical protein